MNPQRKDGPAVVGIYFMPEPLFAMTQFLNHKVPACMHTQPSLDAPRIHWSTVLGLVLRITDHEAGKVYL